MSAICALPASTICDMRSASHPIRRTGRPGIESASWISAGYHARVMSIVGAPIWNMKNGEYAHTIDIAHESDLLSPKCRRHEYASTAARAK